MKGDGFLNETNTSKYLTRYSPVSNRNVVWYSLFGYNMWPPTRLVINKCE